jgi:acyl dehydratase
MSLPTKHLIHQRQVIASMGRTALTAVLQARRGTGAADGPSVPTPGPELRETLAPRPPDLIRDYVRHVGGDPATYRGVLPPHFFPQWGFPLAARTLRDLPYPLARVLNGGCRLEMNAPLPADEPLEVSARLEGIDDNGRRAVMHTKVVTGTRSAPDALIAHMYSIVPLAKADGAGKGPAPSKERPRVPQDARELAYWRLAADAGLAFAMLTGDVNPVHWVSSYARASGFKNTILHGFSTMARTIEGLNRSLFSGDTRAMSEFDCKFTRPLVLPARVGLYVTGKDVFVGDALGGPAYLTGSFTRSRGG